MNKLTDKQELFCREYIACEFNATEAAKRAGYKHPRQVGSENLAKPDIRARISELTADRVERLQIDADWVLQRAVELYQACLNEEQYPTAARALEIVGKNVDVQAFSEKHDHTHNHTGTIEHTKVAEDDKALIRELRKKRGEARVTH